MKRFQTGSRQPKMSDNIQLTDRQRERIERVRKDLKTAEPECPKPSGEQVIDSLLDTWDALQDGHYHGADTESDTYDDITEYDLWLTPHDMDHLEDGAPVFRGVGEHIAIVLRAGDWDTIDNINSDEINKSEEGR